MGENVAQALQFVTEGGAQGGIVANALLHDPAVAARVDHVLIPADWHAPLRQRMVLMKSAGSVAEAFYAFLSSKKARDILARYGFVIPAGER